MCESVAVSLSCQTQISNSFNLLTPSLGIASLERWSVRGVYVHVGFVTSFWVAWKKKKKKGSRQETIENNCWLVSGVPALLALPMCVCACHTMSKYHEALCCFPLPSLSTLCLLLGVDKCGGEKKTSVQITLLTHTYIDNHKKTR